MNRIIKLTSVAMLVVLFTIGLSGCFGNFAATRKVYEFNENFGDKWVNQVMFWIMSVVPVYEFAVGADLFVFNTVEFWTGSNPLAMAPGEEVIKYAAQDGKDLKITIRQNQVIVEDMDNLGQEMELTYKPLDKSWYYHSEEGLVRIASLSKASLTMFRPNGESMTIPKDL